MKPGHWHSSQLVNVLLLLKIGGCLSYVWEFCQLFLFKTKLIQGRSLALTEKHTDLFYVFVCCCLALRQCDASTWPESPLHLYFAFLLHSLLYVFTPTGHNMDGQWAMTLNTHTNLQALKRLNKYFAPRREFYLVLWKGNESTHTHRWWANIVMTGGSCV